MTFEPKSAPQRLSLSERNRKATVTRPQSSNDDLTTNVLFVGQPLTGRCYWEVEWSGATVGIGVYDNLGSDDIPHDYWSLQCYIREECKLQIANAHVQHVTLVYTGHVSSRIGVYLDHSAGTLSFYNVNVKYGTLKLLHSVQITFTMEYVFAGLGFDLEGVGGTAELCDLTSDMESVSHDNNLSLI